jgi:hypothetical protein
MEMSMCFSAFVSSRKRLLEPIGSRLIETEYREENSFVSSSSSLELSTILQSNPQSNRSRFSTKNNLFSGYIEPSTEDSFSSWPRRSDGEDNAFANHFRSRVDRNDPPLAFVTVSNPIINENPLARISKMIS